ncbi:hypothetical protein V7793_18305 [Streptomyces sp. KLMMK]|uniref:hypothetical protein n=1 Tax=Streptomyces sp. KLMMK TaxID=3109353 RepID=UPI003009CF7B
MVDFGETKQAVAIHWDGSESALGFPVYKNIAFTGFPDASSGTDSNISLSDARRRFGSLVSKEQTIEGEIEYHVPDFEKLFTQLPILEQQWHVNNARVVEHASWTEPSLLQEISGIPLSLYVETAMKPGNEVDPFIACAYMGSWVESAPIITQSSLHGPGPASFAYTTLVSETKTRTDTQGYSKGGTIQGALKPPGAGLDITATGTITYTRTVADAHSFTSTGSQTVTVPLEKKERASVEIRLTGARYGGLLAIYYPKQLMRIQNARLQAIMDKWDIAVEDGRNANSVLELFPVRVMAKAAGSNLPMTQSVIFRTMSAAEPPAPPDLAIVSQGFLGS